MRQKALLFDFDGVVADTEGEYSRFWDKMGMRLLGRENFACVIKGSTLSNILQTYFPEREADTQQILSGLDELEKNMDYKLIPGVLDFVREAKRRDFKTAIVTSSNLPKMEFVYKARPEIKSCFDHILTSEDFSASKPEPDCYLKAMQLCGSDPQRSIVFEDSLNGLLSGRRSGARVIGLLTTLPQESVQALSDLQIEDFRDSEKIFEWIDAIGENESCN